MRHDDRSERSKIVTRCVVVVDSAPFASIVVQEEEAHRINHGKIKADSEKRRWKASKGNQGRTKFASKGSRRSPRGESFKGYDV